MPVRYKYILVFYSHQIKWANNRCECDQIEFKEKKFSTTGDGTQCEYYVMKWLGIHQIDHKIVDLTLRPNAIMYEDVEYRCRCDDNERPRKKMFSIETFVWRDNSFWLQYFGSVILNIRQYISNHIPGDNGCTVIKCAYIFFIHINI